MEERSGDGEAGPADEASAPRRRWQIQWGLFVLGAAALVGLVVLSSGGDRAEGSADPEDWDLPALEGGGRVALADFEGKPVVVNFFASWCDACEFELPHLRAASERLEGEVVFVGINSQETGDGLAMAERFGIDEWPLAVDIGPSKDDFHRALGGLGMPVTAFYDAQGNLVDFAGGALSEPALKKRLADLYGVDV
jgi:cytochrome c biogenesis protein CcmG/thiol:disulfide interchange protein DsbE